MERYRSSRWFFSEKALREHLSTVCTQEDGPKKRKTSRELSRIAPKLSVTPTRLMYRDGVWVQGSGRNSSTVNPDMSPGGESDADLCSTPPIVGEFYHRFLFPRFSGNEDVAEDDPGDRSPLIQRTDGSDSGED